MLGVAQDFLDVRDVHSGAHHAGARGVAQVVPAKVVDAGAPLGTTPRRVPALDRPPVLEEHVTPALGPTPQTPTVQDSVHRLDGRYSSFTAVRRSPRQVRRAGVEPDSPIPPRHPIALYPQKAPPPGIAGPRFPPPRLVGHLPTDTVAPFIRGRRTTTLNGSRRARHGLRLPQMIRSRPKRPSLIRRFLAKADVLESRHEESVIWKNGNFPLDEGTYFCAILFDSRCNSSSQYRAVLQNANVFECQVAWRSVDKACPERIWKEGWLARLKNVIHGAPHVDHDSFQISKGCRSIQWRAMSIRRQTQTSSSDPT